MKKLRIAFFRLHPFTLSRFHPLLVALVVAATCALFAQRETVGDGRASRVLANDKLALTMRSVGGTFAQLFLKDDPSSSIHSRGWGISCAWMDRTGVP